MPGRAERRPSAAAGPPRHPRATPVRAPRGRDEIREAVLASAIRLFSERGPAAVSIRDIAHHAGVNHGLVHRHLGGRTELLLLVFDRLRLDVAESATHAASGMDDPQRLLAEIFHATARNEAFFRILARSILDGEDPFARTENFPIAALLLEIFTRLAREGRLSADLRPEVAAATVMATTLGWHLFAPLVVRSTGVGGYRQKAAGEAILAALLTQIAPTTRPPAARPSRRANSRRTIRA